MKPLDLSLYSAVFDYRIGECQYSAFLGGNLHDVETDGDGLTFRWAYGHFWIILPEELSGKNVLFRIECKPYVNSLTQLPIAVSFENPEGICSSYNVISGDGCPLNPSEKFSFCSTRVISEVSMKVYLDHGASVDLNYECSLRNNMEAREFHLQVPVIQEGQLNVLHFVPDPGSVFTRFAVDDKRSMAFAFYRIVAAIIDDE